MPNSKQQLAKYELIHMLTELKATTCPDIFLESYDYMMFLVRKSTLKSLDDIMKVSNVLTTQL